MTIVLSDEIIKIELVFYTKNISVFQGGSNRTYFRLINEHGDTLYFVTPKYLAPTGVHASFEPSEIQELNATARPAIGVSISADETAVSGSNLIRFWVDSIDSNGNKVKSQTYTLNINILKNFTIEKTTSSTTSIKTTVISTMPSTIQISETTVPIEDEILSEKKEWQFSKLQIMIILVIIIIVLVVIPILSFKEKSSLKESTEKLIEILFRK